jgi:hypothetical protein
VREAQLWESLRNNAAAAADIDAQPCDVPPEVKPPRAAAAPRDPPAAKPSARHTISLAKGAAKPEAWDSARSRTVSFGAATRPKPHRALSSIKGLARARLGSLSEDQPSDELQRALHAVQELATLLRTYATNAPPPSARAGVAARIRNAAQALEELGVTETAEAAAAEGLLVSWQQVRCIFGAG